MLNVLGLDTRIFDQVSVYEKTAYRTAAVTFLIVVGMSLLSNGFMGYMLFNSWLAAIGFALFFGFIQFSILRIALITLLSKPLAQEILETPVEVLPTNKKLWTGLKSNLGKIRLSTLFRVVFVGLIALTISFPLSSLINLPSTLEIEGQYRSELIQANKENKKAVNELRQTHFPFHTFEEQLSHSGYKLMLCILIGLVFAPLLLVSRLRYNVKFEYLEKSRQEMLKLVAIDYDETMEQSQHSLDELFPKNKKKLSDLTAFSDAPINSIYKNETKHSIGNKIAFNQFIQSIE
jgi:hypothetical protein